jgi:hypothetical protein
MLATTSCYSHTFSFLRMQQGLDYSCLWFDRVLQDRRNFVRSPPAGVDFQFDYEISYPVAMATLVEDPNLEKMRFELVPKV